ncbi:hypothetical protein CDL60_05755 [Roseateles noduli]|nr:hypothetical protein CDL60_05755 [Roseateles noduli]
MNAETALARTSRGISGADDPATCAVDTRVLVDDQIPPLFGYMPHDEHKGYVTYAEAGATAHQQYAKNQVFESSDFAVFLSALWRAAGGSPTATAPNTAPAILSQSLKVVRNPWFGVQARDTMTIVWVYLNDASDWRAQFKGNLLMEALIDVERAIHHFPNYDTMDTHLSAQQINLLAHLTSWSIVNVEQESGVFSRLFTMP